MNKVRFILRNMVKTVACLAETRQDTREAGRAGFNNHSLQKELTIK